MKLNFRQGIVRHQVDVAGTATFIRKSGNGGDHIDLVCDNSPVIVTFAHGSSDYLIQFSKTIPNAWGPLDAVGTTQYLYWDISMLNGDVSFGYTTVNPHIGTTPPSTLIPDLHWFDTQAKVMKVWNGMKWLIKLRVFAGIYNNSAVLIPKIIGTQVNLNVPCTAGFILKGKNNYPLKDGDGTFIHSESELQVSHTSGENVRFDAAVIYAEATEYIPKFTLVSYVSPRKVIRSSYQNTQLKINGIMVEEYFPGEVGNVISYGLVRNEQWNFLDSDINKPIFTSQYGEVTLIPPPVGVTQEVGYVFDNDAIFLNVQLPIIL
jgi:hypothetical protein